MSDASRRYRPIEDYGIVGDLHTVALVGTDGSIDFMCFPHFDSPSVFAALLDADEGGRFAIAPVREVERHRQLYLPDTNVLLTRFLSHDGVGELTDFMPVDEAGHAHNLVRHLKVVRGRMTFRVRCAPAFDYARADHRVEETGDGLVFESTGDDGLALRLHAAVPLEVDGGGAGVAEVTLEAGEQASFVLEEARPGEGSPCAASGYVAEAFERTVQFWHRWIGRSTYTGRWQREVHRSALALKLLTSQTHGSMVAAPTFGLPEEIGGERNWDYRYTWIRDASFTVYGLSRLGLMEEAGRFGRWIERCCDMMNEDGSLQIMYGLDGRRRLDEQELPHLEGYRGSRPVRIGNGAYDQLQLDIYGELMDSLYLYDKYGEPIHYDLWMQLCRMLEWVCDNWSRADTGIWEVRGGRKEFLYSRVMCWVALDRGVRLARRRSLPGNRRRWEAVRDEIHRDVFTNFWHPERQAFVQHRHARVMDAAALTMPLVRMIGPTDPRWLSTLRAVERDLVSDSLVYRYDTSDEVDDGLSGGEGTFSICTFWYVECLSRAGYVEQARFIFEKMLGYANHVGLFSEELGPCGEHLGNFPQAFTHLALISAAYELDRRLSEPASRRDRGLSTASGGRSLH